MNIATIIIKLIYEGYIILAFYVAAPLESEEYSYRLPYCLCGIFLYGPSAFLTVWVSFSCDNAT